MKGTIPVMRVNYTIPQLLGSMFVTEHSTKYREQLMERLRIFFSIENVMLTSSTRCGIYMIVSSLPQRKVVVPSYTCEVVIEAVKLAGKEVVFAPVSKKTLNISEYPAIDSDTIVIATHQYGLPCEMKELVAVCREKKAVIIEDCAGAFGSRIGGKLAGTFGDYAVFSFSASKTVHSPTKGGFIIARNKELIDKIKPLTDVSKDGKAFKLNQTAKAIEFCLAKNEMLSAWLFSKGHHSSNHDESYINDSTYRRSLYEWQAYVLLKQMEDIEAIQMERRQLYKRYHADIKNPYVACLPVYMGGIYSFCNNGC